ncbi:uncharacterized protein LOC143218391 [Lasioglossum baleicum]|uniref:uncharacterized protein LOC143218391 n=1 Tax=Lasioglossum baleicum TaxID=434251 RepID=UPI003FCE35E1
MVAKLCVVLNCPGNYSSLYKFPKDRKYEKRISKWLSTTGNKELLHLPEKLLLERAVRNLHFEAKYIVRRGFSLSAVPSLCLPDPIEVPLDHFCLR